jgi:phage baseplate assembly protein W
MPFNPQQINPVDLNPNVAVGVNLPLNGPAVFISNFTTKDATKNNLINFFLTNPGERYFNSNFGGGLRAFIFEQIAEDNLYKLENRIETQLKNFFPYIIILSLDILNNSDNNTIIIQLKYTIQNTNITDNLEIEL